MNEIDYSQILTVFYPNTQWTYVGGEGYAGLQWLDTQTPKPSQTELDSKWDATQEDFKKQDCKQQASKLLYDTDWTTIPDVADPANSPYLTNQAEFIDWRNQIRELAVNPVANPVFPTKPEAVWG